MRPELLKMAALAALAVTVFAASAACGARAASEPFAGEAQAQAPEPSTLGVAAVAESPTIETVPQAEPGPARSTAAAESPTIETVQAESSPAIRQRRDTAVPAPVASKTGAGVGDRVPEFELKLVDGSTVSSQELIGEGRPVFLFSHASW